MIRGGARAAMAVVALGMALSGGVLPAAAQTPSAAGQAPAAAPPPVKGTVPASKPAWTRGIQPLNRDSYYHAIECGKNGAAQPSCVFYDAELCKNADFVLSFYSPYKQVAYEVWSAVSRKRPAPTPSYQSAQQTRVVIGITPVRGAGNQIANVLVKRGGKTIEPDTRTIDGTSGNFIFGFPPFAPTSTITLEMVGKARTIACVLDRAALSRLR